MKPATVQEIKQALQGLSASQLSDLCLRLVKLKKDNKELLTYLLFEQDHADAYLKELKAEIALDFESINKSQLYFTRKSLRRILRMIARQLRYIGTKPAEVELLLAFCQQLKGSGIPLEKSAALENLYHAQLRKVEKLIGDLHEDLQYDYRRSLKALQQG